MSHELRNNGENMLYSGETPWHGLGKNISGETCYNITECIEIAGMNRPVGLKKLFAENGVDNDGNPIYQPIPERYTFDELSGALFGCVGPRYVPLQNIEAFQWFQPWLDTREVSIHTAGLLYNGEKLWVQAKIEVDAQEVRAGDNVECYVMLSNSHDGTTAIRVGLTPQRIVCKNTLTMAIKSDVSKLIRVKHTSKAKQNIDNIRESIDLVRRDFFASIELYRKLSNKAINQADLRKYVRFFFDIPDTMIENNIPKRTMNQMLKVYQRYEFELSVAGATWWNAWNSCNWFLNHEYGRSAENRLDSLWFGVNSGVDKVMLDLALRASE